MKTLLYTLVGGSIFGSLGALVASPPDPWWVTGLTGFILGALITLILRHATN